LRDRLAIDLNTLLVPLSLRLSVQVIPGFMSLRYAAENRPIASASGVSCGSTPVGPLVE